MVILDRSERFLWGVTSSVGEIDSSIVSLQACLIGLTSSHHRAQHLFFGAAFRPRAKEERTLSSPQVLFRMYMS